MAESNQLFSSGTRLLAAKNNSLYTVVEKGADVEAGQFYNVDRLGSLAAEFVPNENGEVDIVHDYPWTMNVTKGRSDIPFIQLKEFRVNESSIKRKAFFFAAGGTFIGNPLNNQVKQTNSVLDVYDELFPRDNPTGWRYVFPYFDEVNMELSTDSWKALDSLEEGVKKVLNKVDSTLGDVVDVIQGFEKFSTNFQPGVVEIFDRPKVFGGHSPRTIKVNFPLYNTIAEPKGGQQAWSKNRQFIYLFMNQNLFNKRDLTTGISPVFYEVFIPGAFYSAACCVTNFTVTNKGGLRTLYEDDGRPVIVPDIYEISISLTDLVMPSRNNFQASDSYEAYNRVRSSTVGNARSAQNIQNIITQAEQAIVQREENAKRSTENRNAATAAMNGINSPQQFRSQ
jgi:hypothetical protein